MFSNGEESDARNVPAMVCADLCDYLIGALFECIS